MPIAREREKNIWPPAAESTPMKSVLMGSKLGANMNFRPSMAPGRVSERRMTMTSMMNRAGMPTLLNFSMPSLMPPRIMRKQMKTKRKVKATEPNWLVSMDSKVAPPDMPAIAATPKARSARFRDIYSMQ